MSGPSPSGAPSGAGGTSDRLGRVIGLLGPTGVGKSAVAAEVARLLGTRVISCDSMQVYRGFPVLTNQPTEAERRGVEHALVACVDPASPFSAAEYAAAARPLIAADLERAGAAVVAGGTGLYLRAALAPLSVAARDEHLRAKLEARAVAEGAGALHSELARLDPDAAAAIDPRNSRRVVRALEAILAGQTWSGRGDLWQPVYDHPTVIFGLSLERAELYRRIDARARLMLECGAIDEVRRFREERGLGESRPGGPGIRSAIGYPEICRYLDAGLSLEEAIGLIAAATRRYARRQLTWLRKVEGAVIIEVRDRPPAEVARQIVESARCA